MTIYLDHAATTPVRPEVLAAMEPFLRGEFGNPSSQHENGTRTKAALQHARERVAAVLGMRVSDVVFTSGGTEAINMVIKGMMIAAGEHGKKHIVTTVIEHQAVLASVDYLRRIHGCDVSFVPVDHTGIVDPDDVASVIRDDTAVVSIGYANNEVGTVQDIPQLAAKARERGAVFHTDAVQAVGWLPLSGTGADALCVSGHKFGAPKGTGIAAVRGRIPREPLIHGGGQERGLRSGTENVAGAVGIAVALEIAEAERAEAAPRVSALRDSFIVEVLRRYPTALLTGAPERRLPGTASFLFPGINGETILLELERRGVIASSGSACAAGQTEPSHVLLALGFDADQAQTAVRFTFSHHDQVDLDVLLKTVISTFDTLIL